MSHFSRLRAGVFCLATLAMSLAGVTAASAAVQSTALNCAKPDGRVAASVIGSGVVYVGGTFTHVTDLSGNPQARAGLAAIDLSTCDLLPWKADTNNKVFALTISGGTVYAGGAFTSVAGQPRYGLAALDSATGSVLPFAPRVSGMVKALTTSGTILYAGGTFTKVNGSARQNLAAFDTTTGILSGAWQPNAAGQVRALTPSADGARIYVGGTFTALNGSTASGYLGAVEPTSGALDTGFQPSVPFPILSLVADTRGVYAGGGGSGGHLAIWNLDGSLQRPVFQTDGDVQAIAVAGDTVYGGGHFDNYCVGNTGSGAPFICDKPLIRRKLLEVSLTTGEVTMWAPKLNSNLGVFTEAVDPASGDLWVGGDFTTVNRVPQPHLAVFRNG